MNENVKDLIKKEYESQSPDSKRNAMFINKAEVNGSFRLAIEQILLEYSYHKIDADQALLRISELDARVKNDLRDGLMMIQKLFGEFHKGSIIETDKKLLELYQTFNWIEIHPHIYPRIYGKEPDPASNTNVVSQDAVRKEESGNPKLESLLNELNQLTGLKAAKEKVNEIIALNRYNAELAKRGMNVQKVMMHMVFTGNPGTGKTTVAKLIGQIYKELGILSKGNLVIKQRSDLVGQYVGHSEEKTKQVIESALGGILFIDEAYSLAPKGANDNDFGEKVIDELIIALENHRDDFMVIVAGYPDRMEEFINANPGLKSRFPHFVSFDDYNGVELFDIYQLMVNSTDYHTEQEALPMIRDFLEQMYANRDDNFANAREVRNFIDDLKLKLALRVANSSITECTTNELLTFTASDFENTIHQGKYPWYKPGKEE